MVTQSSQFTEPAFQPYLQTGAFCPFCHETVLRIDRFTLRRGSVRTVVEVVALDGSEHLPVCTGHPWQDRRGRWHHHTEEAS